MLWLGLLSMPVAVQAQGFSTTMLRFGCSQITIDRIDPYVSACQRKRKMPNVVVVLSSLAASRRPTSIRSSAV